MNSAERAAGEFLLARFLRLSAALAATPRPAQAGQLLVNRIGEVLSCERAVLATLSPPQPCYASDDVKPAQHSVLADAIELALTDAGSDHGPVRFTLAEHGAQLRRRASDPPPTAAQTHNALQRMLAAHGGSSILWWPLPARDGGPARHALWLERHRGRHWSDEEVLFAHRFGPLLGALLPPAQRSTRRRARAMGAVATGVLLGAVAALPVPSAVTAAAQVVAADPQHVFSPLDGVIGTLAVVPGQHVQAGDLLLRMDTRVLEKAVDEARQTVAVAQAELARVRAASHYDADARARLTVTQIELERAGLELDFQLAQLGRAQLRSEMAGQVVLEDPDRLPGAAVRMGERLLSIADTGKTQLRIMVPLADFSLVDEAAAVRVSLDRTPLSAVAARVERRGYAVQLSDDQVPSIRVDAHWIEPAPDVFPGARGTARINGKDVALIQHLLRKPLQALRRAWGL